MRYESADEAALIDMRIMVLRMGMISKINFQKYGFDLNPYITPDNVNKIFDEEKYPLRQLAEKNNGDFDALGKAIMDLMIEAQMLS